MDQLTRTAINEQERQNRKTGEQLLQTESTAGRAETAAADWNALPRVQGAEPSGKRQGPAAGFPKPAAFGTGLEFQYESDAATSFLIVKCNAHILEYQALMLRYNRLKYIMPVDIIIKEGVHCFYYNITSHITLSFFLKRQKLNREQFLKLLLSIASAINDSAGYLLADSNFLLDPGFIYVNPQTLEPALVYIPAALEQECGVSLQDFIAELLLLHVNVEGFAEGNLVQRVLAAVKCETFNLKSLILLLSDLLYQQSSHPGSDETTLAAELVRQGYEQLQRRVGKQHGVSPSGKAKNGSHFGSVGNVDASRNTGIAGNISASKNTGAAGNINAAREASTARDAGRVKKDYRPVILAVMAQFIMAGAIYFNRGALISASDNAAITFTAVAVIVIALEVLIAKKLHEAGYIPAAKGKEDTGGAGMDDGSGAKPREILTGARNSPKVISGAKISSEGITKLEVTNIADPKLQVPHAASPDPLADRDAAACDPACGETAGKAPEILQKAAFSGKTELLIPGNGEFRILRSIGWHPGEQDIPISKDDFIIGRLEGHVDHVLKNNAVGKLHAQLLTKNGICTIKDLNSVNGTFINGKRIESNREFKLNGNDRVLLANSEFIYIDG